MLSQRFLKAKGNGDDHLQPVRIEYKNMWEFLRSRHTNISDTMELERISLLEAYYLGFLNTGCEGVEVRFIYLFYIIIN